MGVRIIAKTEALESIMASKGETSKSLALRVHISCTRFSSVLHGSPTSVATSRAICRELKTKFREIFDIATNGNGEGEKG